MSHPRIPDDVLTRIARAQRVSKGELDALKLALTQCKSKEIAKQLGISEAATRKRLGEVYKKFGIKGRGPGKLASLEQQLIEKAEAKTTGAGRGIDNHSEWRFNKKDRENELSELGLFSERDRPPTLSTHTSKQALKAASLAASPGFNTQYHWNDAPALNLFQGRREVLTDLKQWVVQPAAAVKVLAVCGIGGIGKTSVVLRLAESVRGYFEQVIWLTLRPDQTPAELVEALLMFFPQEDLSGEVSIPAPKRAASHKASMTTAAQTVKALIAQLMDRLAERRTLVILDGFETVFKGYQSGRLQGSLSGTPTFHATRHQQASLYQDGLEAYGELLKAFCTVDAGNGQERNASALVITSREKPRELLSMPGVSEPAESQLAYLYTLDGLRDHEAARMLSRFRLQGESADYKALIDRYYGHPMALRLAANAVKDLFYGRIRDFLEQEISVFDDLRSILKTQVRRLSSLELEAMYWLAINRVPCTLESLQADIVSQDHKKNLLYTLQSLERRFLIEVKQLEGVSYQLHPIVAEYVLSRFIREIFQDLIQGDLSLFNSHALMKADAEESCRQFQRDHIVRPILERLRNYQKSLLQVDEYLGTRLDAFREDNPYRLGYAGGNFVNLMVELSHGKLSRKDFSNLTIWQAYLQGAELRDVNFNRCELDRSVFTETLSDVMTVALSQRPAADGQSVTDHTPLLACGDTNGVVHLWTTDAARQLESSRSSFGSRSGRRSGRSSEVNAGQKCAEWSAHSGWVRSLAFFTRRRRKGLCLVTGGDDSQLKLWQLPAPAQSSTAQARLLWQKNTADWVHTLAVSPDGELIASGGDNRITLYHAANGQIAGEFFHQAVSSQESDVASAAVSQTADYPASQLTKHTQVRSLTFSADSQWLASCGDDDIIRLWSVAALRANSTALPLPSAELIGHTGWVRSVQFTPDGSRLISGSDDGTVRIWSINQAGKDLSVLSGSCTGPCTERLASQRVLRQSGDHVRSVAISPDGRLLASGGDDCQVRLWDLQTYQLLETVSTQLSRIWSVAFQQQDHKLLLAAGGDKQTLNLWQLHSHQLEHYTVTARQIRTYRGYTNGIRSVCFLGAQRIVSGGDSRELSVWNSETGQHKANLSLHQGRIWAIAVDTQNARIASASDDHTIRLWDASSGQCLTTFSEHTSWVRTVDFSQRGRFLASSGDDCTIRIWNTASGFCMKVLSYSTHWIHSVRFDPTNSRYLISGGDDRIVRRWDRKEGISTSLAEHDQRICSVAYSPDARWVASGSDDNTVILWDMEKGELCDRFTQPDLGIKSVAFSPNGRYLAAGGEDQLVYLWDLSTPKRKCIRLRPEAFTGLTGGIRSVAFSPDSRFVISGGLDAAIRVADLSQLSDEKRADAENRPILMPLIQPARPYEKTEIEGVKGLSHLQLSNLLSLGAVKQKRSLFP